MKSNKVMILLLCLTVLCGVLIIIFGILQMLIGFICCFAIFGITALLLKSLYRIPEKIVAKEPIADIKYEFNSDIKKIDISKEDFFKSMRIDFINTKKSNVEKLKEYIELLYAGIITQEEFDIKKRQLLGL